MQHVQHGDSKPLCSSLHVAAAVCVTASSYTSSSVSCDDGEDYIPDSEDCTRFWRCANGKPYSFTCPAGLRFNVDISVCDWPDNVRCGATYTEDGSEEDSDDDEEHDEDNSDEEEETTYPYQPGPKYYDRKYYTENPNYFKPTAAPVYRPIPTRRPVYKPVYISKPQTGKPDFIGNFNKNYNNYQPPAYPQFVQGNSPWQQQQQPYPLPVNNLFPVSGKQPLPWVPPLPAQPLPPAPGIGGHLPLESDTEVGKIPVLPKHFENQHLLPPYPVGGPLVPPHPVGGPFGQPLPLGKPLPFGPPFPIGKPVFGEQLFPGTPDHPIAIKAVNSQPILTHPLPIGSPQLGCLVWVRPSSR
ncbi:hypothetical protein C0Q70_02480 [Pomacea canaliculata]|uniref:Chitin-binding type-2 domain-containing protein n=1 Tax=Pomacea canaliculata TaxID=400727 RepID=A0A2T7PQ63_POMCA|nr:hypothetical protein C0Q70_02480 [Pomacea canaliculata]